MSIFSKLNPVKLIKKIGKIPLIKKLAPVGKIIYKKLAPNELKLALKIADKLKSLIIKDHKMENEFEKTVRLLVETVDDFKDATGVDKALVLIPLIKAAQDIGEAMKEPAAILNPKVLSAFDNLVGDEENALIGTHPNAKIQVNTGFLPLEQLSDILGKIAIDKLIPIPAPTE